MPTRLGNSAGWGNPHKLGVRVSTGQGAGQRLMTRDPSRVTKRHEKKHEKHEKTAFFDVFSRFFLR
jgi:hypothetical protein